jgi:hypothetical protein
MPFIPGAFWFAILQNAGVIPHSVGGATDAGNEILRFLEGYNDKKYEMAANEFKKNGVDLDNFDFTKALTGGSTNSSPRSSEYYDAPQIQYKNSVVSPANPNR